MEGKPSLGGGIKPINSTHRLSTTRVRKVLLTFFLGPPCLCFIASLFPVCAEGLNTFPKKKTKLKSSTLEKGVPLCFKADITNFPSYISAVVCVCVCEVRHQRWTVQEAGRDKPSHLVVRSYRKILHVVSRGRQLPAEEPLSNFIIKIK